jgi:hypothetical protein
MSSSGSEISYDQKKGILEEIKSLSKLECEEIFRIIKRGNVEYTENSNGIFFDIMHLSDEIVYKIQKFLDFCKTQRKSEEERAHEIDILRHETSVA